MLQKVTRSELRFGYQCGMSKNFTVSMKKCQFSTLMCLLYDKQYHFYIKDCNAGIKLEYVQTKSALLCLKEFSNRANQSKEKISYFIAIQQLLSKGINLSLHWIPGHRKIGSNEQADLAAKMAASADMQIMQTIVFQIEDII